MKGPAVKNYYSTYTPGNRQTLIEPRAQSLVKSHYSNNINIL